MNASWRRLLGIVLGAILFLIAGLHAYWALGGAWGIAEALGGADKPVPSAGLILVVAGLLVAAVLVVWGRVGMWERRVPSWFFGMACWGLAVALFLAALMNFLAHTNWERYGFGPFALALAIATGLVARPPRSPGASHEP